LTKFFESNRTVIVTLFLTAVFMHIERLGFWDWSYVKLWDEGNNVLPYHLTDAASLADKISSFWQPKYAAGVDHLATGTRTGPESFLFSFLPSWIAYGLYKILGFFLGAVFVFKLLRDRMETGFFPAMLAGIIFMVLQPDALWNKLSVLALPAAVYAISWRAAEKSGGLAFAFATGIIYELGGQIVLSLSLISTVLFWLLFIERLSLKRSTILFSAFFAGILAVEIHTLWAFVVNGNLSHRGHFTLSAPEITPFLIKLKLAFFNSSAFLLVLAIAVSRNGSKKGLRRNIIVFLTACLINLYHPLFDVFRYLFQDISTLIVAYSTPKGLDATIWFAISAGLSLDSIFRHDKFIRITAIARQASMAASISFALVATIVGGILFEKVGRLWNMLYDENFSYMYRHPDLLRLAAENKNSPPYRVATPFILSDTGYVLPTFVWSYGFEAVDGYVSMYSERYHSYWLRVLAGHEDSKRYKSFQGNSSAIYLFGNPTDRGPMCPDQSMSCPVEFEKNYDLELLSLANTRYFISARKLTSPNLRLLPSNIRGSLFKLQNSRLRERLTLKMAGEYVGPPLYIYENKIAFPRFFLTGGVRLFDNKEKLLPALSQAKTSDMRKSAFVRRDDIKDRELENQIEQLPTFGEKGGFLKTIRYERDEIIIQIETDRPRVFVATNNFSPFWKADLDRLPLTIFPVYNTFQGILVPKGRHTLRLRYLPPYSPRTYLPSN